VRPNYARCKRTPILVVPGSGQNLTHECLSFEIDVNGCGYEQKSGFTSFCSFFGNSERMDGTKVQNAPYTRGKVTSNQQIQCTSPSGTKELRSDFDKCKLPQFENSSFVIGPRNFSITEAAISIEPRVCTLDSAIWFPLERDSQVKFTFYDDPAFLNLTATSNSTKSSSSTPLSFLRVSTIIALHALCILFLFFIDDKNPHQPKSFFKVTYFQVNLLDSGFSDLSLPFQTSLENPSNPANTIEFASYYRTNTHDM
jgi:hypothetical protein